MAALETGGGLGFGAMRLSEPSVELESARGLVQEALERGVRLFDPADVYAPSAAELGHNETRLADAIARAGISTHVTLATKGGLRRKGKSWLPDGRAKHLKAACAASRERLGVDRVDLYQLHAPDPKVPFATSVRALRSLQKDGLIRDIGLCNVRLEELETALDLAPITTVQVELSPLHERSLKNGVVKFCADRGIVVLAHSPLGGHRRHAQLGKHPVLRSIGERHGVSAYEIALAWLRKIDPLVIPLVGVTRRGSLASSVHALDVELTDEDLELLDDALPAGRVLRSPRERPRESPSTRGEIVLFVGYPGAGKSTAAERWLEQGFVRVNRDEEGGRLSSLLPLIESYLVDGKRRLVLDNTYPRRDARFDVLELAAKHGVPVRCVWLSTSIEQAQVNAVARMVRRFGRLLDAEEIKAEGDANTFTPEAQFRYRRELEPPRMEEGFVSIDKVPFAPHPEPKRKGRAVFIGEIDITDARRSVLEHHRQQGYRLLQLIYAPGRDEPQGEEAEGGLGLEIYYCPHPPGPAICWCRKPLPGLGVWLIAKYALDPARCLALADSGPERAFAERLRIPAVSAVEFFGSSTIE